eukprot:6180933-Prymnesium_polylepis.1
MSSHTHSAALTAPASAAPLVSCAALPTATGAHSRRPMPLAAAAGSDATHCCRTVRRCSAAAE